MSSFSKGYHDFANNAVSQINVEKALQYVRDVELAVEHYAELINHFQGVKTPVNFLKGNIAEAHHSGSFNIDAALRESSFKTTVEGSNRFASVDISSNFGQDFGLKYMSNATESAKHQAKSYFEKYNEFSRGSKEISFESFLSARGIDQDTVMHDPIYNGQVRIIPEEHLEEAIAFLKYKIAKEEITRPDQVFRYRETLDLLSDKIEAPDGTQSVSLSNEEAQRLTELGKKGDFDSLKNGLSTEELIQFGRLLSHSIKAGTTAAIISVVLKTTPEIIKTIKKLLNNGYIEKEQFKKIGFAAVKGSIEGFIRGAVASSLTVACKGGALGATVKSVNPTIIGALTAVCLSAMQDSFLVASGELERETLIANLTRNLFITSSSIGLGTLFQTFLPIPVFGFLLGNFVGSLIGGFAYDISGNIFMSYCVNSGFTFFGLVKQNYELPDVVLKEIGLDLLNLDQIITESFEYDHFQFDEFLFDDHRIDYGISFTIMKRGVIGIREIGYV